MKLAVFAYSRKGCETALRVKNCFPEAEYRAYAPARLGDCGLDALEQESAGLYAQLFAWADAMIFVGACGIAVRSVAPLLQDKCSDPAVLCLDERAQFVISLLSGHIGGANALCRLLADRLDACPVITTATDINGKFSVDTWAAKQGFVIGEMELAKAVSAAVLEGDVPVCSEFPVVSEYPEGLTAGDSGVLGICVSCRRREPFERTLHLIPRVLHLGIGCRKGIGTETIQAVVEAVLQQHSIDPRAVCCAASVDRKAQEQGLLEYCRRQNWPIRFYTPEQLQAVPGSFAASAFVQETVGVDNVCERAALLGASRLIVKKTAADGVTVAIAEEELKLHFGICDGSGHRPRRL